MKVQLSLLPIFGNMFKKLFGVIYKHICVHSRRTPNQSGSLPGDSTIYQPLSITHKIHTGFENTPSKEAIEQSMRTGTLMPKHKLQFFMKSLFCLSIETFLIFLKRVFSELKTSSTAVNCDTILVLRCICPVRFFGKSVKTCN